jgi:methylthioribose-1-phosphate isomerase
MTADIKPTFHWEEGRLIFLDQTLLPQREVEIRCRELPQLAEAIKSLRIRGAPALGIAAAFGVALHVWHDRGPTSADLLRSAEEAADILRKTRPTAVNLFWALDRMLSVARPSVHLPIAAFKQRLLDEAQAILKEDLETGRAIGANGLKLIPQKASIITHCNAGGLATGGYGTALAVVFAAAETGRDIHVFVDETRPLLQGARLTAYELKRAGIDHTLIADSMAASLLAQGKVNLAIVGADRIASNGDVANKIGTYSLAIACDYHSVPFYVAAPTSTVDLSLPEGSRIPIEHRAPEEVRGWMGNPAVPEGTPCWNPAFDVTPAKLISAIITEEGVLYPPYDLPEALKSHAQGVKQDV